MRDYWLECTQCKHSWIGKPYDQGEFAELCPECDSDDFEIGSEYRPFKIEAFWLLLIVPNFLLWGLA